LQAKHYLKIAKIIKTHGIKGEVKLLLYSENITQYEDCYLANHKVKIRFRGFKENNAIAKIDNIDNLDEAQNLKNAFLFIKKTDLPKIKDSSFYYVDLIDSKVLHNQEVIGKVTNAVNYGAGDILTIYFLKNEKEEDFPFTDEIFPKIDLKKKEIIFIKPEII
jgi:16S rRNA processing protein RimM